MVKRRRSTPWIHRWSRILIGGMASIGALGTLYLTVIKFLGGEAACPTSGCERVLSSDYAIIFGLPLSLFGFLAYGAMLTMAIGPLLLKGEGKKELRSQLEKWTWLLMFAQATAMTVFSAYLMYLLAFEIKALCIYCIVSACLSLGFLILTIIGHDWEDVGQVLFTGVVVGLIALVATLGIYAPISARNDPNGPQRQATGELGAAVTTISGDAEIELAKHLTQSGAKMFGAYWCPHCHDQKQMFGKEAAKALDYVECDPQGVNPRVELCKAANIQGFPSWEINGQVVAGTQPLEELARLSRYTGPQNFNNLLGR